MKALSPKMLDALDRAREAGALYFWPGGYWRVIVPGSHPRSFDDIHGGDWYAGTRTICGLIDRGYLTVTAEHRGKYRAVRPVPCLSHRLGSANWREQPMICDGRCEQDTDP